MSPYGRDGGPDWLVRLKALIQGHKHLMEEAGLLGWGIDPEDHGL